jgi:hypothetical protein
VVGRSDPIFSGVSVVVEDGGTAPPAPPGVVAPAVALAAGQEMPAAGAGAVPVAVGGGEPPQAVASRATPMPSALSLATRGAPCGSEVIYNLLDLKVRTAFDAKDQVFLI